MTKFYRRKGRFSKKKTESGEDYLLINPKGQMPTLLLDKEITLAWPMLIFITILLWGFAMQFDIR